MKNKVCTLEQAKCLVDLGIDIDAWKSWCENCGFPFLIDSITSSINIVGDIYPAPNSDELIAEIPSEININGLSYNLIFRKVTESSKVIYICDVVDAADSNDWYFDFKSDHFAWLLADVLIWICGNKQINLDVDQKYRYEGSKLNFSKSTEELIVHEAETIEKMHRS